jgi:hypothetical protein
MNEAPKKIWIHEGFWRSGDAGYWTGDEKTFSEDIHYIRADIVDELVEVLEKLRVWTRPGNHKEYVEPMIEAALKKLEESND